MYLYVACVQNSQRQKRVLDPPELSWKVVVTQLRWVLEGNFESSRGTFYAPLTVDPSLQTSKHP